MTSSHVQTSAFIRALIDNAKDLLSDANLLLGNQRFARAFVLAVLAREEAGKAMLVLAHELGDTDVDERQLASHRDKLRAAATTELAFLGNLEDFQSKARTIWSDETHSEKLSGLYVDLHHGDTLTPASITQERAEQACAATSEILRFLDALLGGLSPEMLEAAQHLTMTLGPTLDDFATREGDLAALDLARQLASLGVAEAEKVTEQQKEPQREPGEGQPKSSLGHQARWGALSHRLAGEVASVEWQLNLVLALATGRDIWAVHRSLQLVQRLPIEERARLLDDLDVADGLAQTTAAWLRELASVRNQLAHSWIVDASKEAVAYRSFYRGRHKEFTVTESTMAGHLRKSARVLRNLIWLETLVGDRFVWGELMGFDSRD